MHKCNHIRTLAKAKSGIYGKVRRYLLGKLHSEYILQKMKEREGQCRQCGNCCRLLFKCPFLVGSNGSLKCLIYHSEIFRPRPCRDFPIDERDLADVGFNCGYHFTNSKI